MGRPAPSPKYLRAITPFFFLSPSVKKDQNFDLKLPPGGLFDPNPLEFLHGGNFLGVGKATVRWTGGGMVGGRGKGRVVMGSGTN